MQNSKTNTILLITLIILIIGLGIYFVGKDINKTQIPIGDTKYDADPSELKSTYTYTNHGFSIELPKGFKPSEEITEMGPTAIYLNDGAVIYYITNPSFWEKYNIPSYTYIKDEKIGSDTFKVYNYNKDTFYWFRKGNVSYELHGKPDVYNSFKFVGWPQIEGDKDSLVSFSIKSGQEVSGKVSYPQVLSLKH